MPMDERELLDGLIAGDEGAARAFVAEYRFVVMGVLRRFRQLAPQDADDLFVEAFERLWRDERRALKQVARDWRPGSLSRYLRTLTLRLAIDRLRASREVPVDWELGDCDNDDELELLLQLRGAVTGGPAGTGSADPLIRAQLGQLRRMFGDALAGLSDRCREVISFVHLLEHSYDEASAHFGMTRSNLGVTLMRCRKSLADILVREYPAIGEYLREAL
jgi:RNA polymerase sigma factor (sigma-70 family)